MAHARSILIGILTAATGCGGGSSSTAPAPTSAPTPTPTSSPEPAPAPDPAPAAAPTGGPTPAPAPPGMAGGQAHPPSTPIGTLRLAGRQVSVGQHGDTTAGMDMGFEVNVDGDPMGVAVFVWMEDMRQRQASPSKTDEQAKDGKWHVHVMSSSEEADLAWVVVRIRTADKDERGRLPLLGVGNPPPHGGVVAEITDGTGATVGRVELHRHTQTGELRAWFYAGEGFASPMDIEGGTVTVEFMTPEERTLKLQSKDPRNGIALFPGNTGGDASWLAGVEFDAMASVKVAVGGKNLVSDTLVLE